MSDQSDQLGGQPLEGASKNAAFRPRTSARLAVVQALYQIEITDISLEDVIAQFAASRLRQADAEHNFGPADEALFQRILTGVRENEDEINALLASILSKEWSLGRLESILRAIVRAASHELMAMPDVPRKTVINEYVDVTHAFFADKEPGFVNTVLDQVASKVRPDEIRHGTG